MLVEDPEERFTIDQCVTHPWLAKHYTTPEDSTEPGKGSLEQEWSRSDTPLPGMSRSGKDKLPADPKVSFSPSTAKSTAIPKSLEDSGNDTDDFSQRLETLGYVQGSKSYNYSDKASRIKPPITSIAQSSASPKPYKGDAAMILHDNLELLKLDSATDFTRMAETTSLSDSRLKTKRFDWETDVWLDRLSEEVQQDMRLFMDNSENHAWIYTPSQNSNQYEIPLKVNGFPVVIPVHYGYPLTPILSPPPDPHPRIISPTEAIPDRTIEEIFALFSEAIGFYVLINGYLQIIVPDEFEYDRELAKYPDHFGGLKVSFIPLSIYPTTGRSEARSGSSVSELSQAEPNWTSDPSSSARTGPVSTLEEPRTESRTITMSNSATRSFKLAHGSSFRAAVRDSKTRERFEGKFGVLVSPLADNSRRYVTVPTHVFTAAVEASKTTSLPSSNWYQSVKAVSVNESMDVSAAISFVYPDCPSLTFAL
jgi:hypothetical protein